MTHVFLSTIIIVRIISIKIKRIICIIKDAMLYLM